MSNPAAGANVDMKFEIVVIPVADVDRAKEFYARLGWRLDADFESGPEYRVVQFTPPGSGCSVIFGVNVTAAQPGSAQGLYLVVSDIAVARAELLSRGIEVGEVFHPGDDTAGQDDPYLFGRLRLAGAAPDGESYKSFASFQDPDGNGWLFQEVTTRLPGRVAGDTNPDFPRREPELAGQTVVLIGGSAGIGLETARRARTEGAEVILTGRNPARLAQAALDVGAQRTAAFDADDPEALARFFRGLSAPIDHVLVTAGGPSYGLMLEMDSAQVRQALGSHVVLALDVARNAVDKMRPGGTLLLMGGTGGRRISRDLGIVSAATAALPPFTAALALELAPVRVNLIAAGFVDTPLSASLLGAGLEERRNELRAKLPIGRVVGPADVAALAVHIMSNTALTGATYDIDGGQQFVF